MNEATFSSTLLNETSDIAEVLAASRSKMTSKPAWESRSRDAGVPR